NTRSRVGSGPSGTGEPRAIPIPALEPPPPTPPPEEWLFHSCSGYSGQLLCRPDAGLTAAPPNPPAFRQWPGQPKPWLAERAGAEAGNPASPTHNPANPDTHPAAGSNAGRS